MSYKDGWHQNNDWGFSYSRLFFLLLLPSSSILDRLSLAGTILVLDLGSWSLTSDLHVNERRRANGFKPVRDQYQYQCFDSTSSEGANWYHSNSCPRGKGFQASVCQASKCLYEGEVVDFLENKFQPMQTTVMIPTRLTAVYRSL